MNTYLTSFIALSAFALSLGACTPEQRLSGKHPGSYEVTETSTNANGTTTVKTSTTVVTVDEDGNKKETITSKTTKDPHGLMNKKTTKKTLQTTEQN